MSTVLVSSSIRVTGALPGRLTLSSQDLRTVCVSNRMAHLLPQRLHLVRWIAGVSHGAACFGEPTFKKGPRPLDIVLPYVEVENACNVVRIVLLIAHQLESDSPRPGHANEHKPRRGEDGVHADIRGKRRLIDRVAEFAIYTSTTFDESDVISVLLCHDTTCVKKTYSLASREVRCLRGHSSSLPQDRVCAQFV